MGRIILDFFAVLIVCGLLLSGLTMLFPALGNVGGAVSTVVASMVAGQLYGNRTGEEVTSGFAWKVAAILAALSVVFSFVVIAGLNALALLPVNLAGISAYQLLLGPALIGLLSLLAIRFTFRSGVKQGARIKKN